MLKIAHDVKAFLEGAKFQCVDCEYAPATFLALCTYVGKPHTKPLCDKCAQQHDSICECGSGGCASGTLYSYLSQDGVETEYSDFQNQTSKKRQKN